MDEGLPGRCVPDFQTDERLTCVTTTTRLCSGIGGYEPPMKRIVCCDWPLEERKWLGLQGKCTSEKGKRDAAALVPFRARELCERASLSNLAHVGGCTP
jgi:hypothetical protein